MPTQIKREYRNLDTTTPHTRSISEVLCMIQYSFLGRTAASIRLNTMFRELAPSPSSGKTDLTYNSSVPCFSTWRGRENQKWSIYEYKTRHHGWQHWRQKKYRGWCSGRQIKEYVEDDLCSLMDKLELPTCLQQRTGREHLGELDIDERTIRSES
jgi:hypothetical protein